MIGNVLLFTLNINTSKCGQIYDDILQFQGPNNHNLKLPNPDISISYYMSNTVTTQDPPPPPHSDM